MTDTGSTAPDDPTAPVGVTAEGLDAEEQAGAAPWYRRPISWILIAVLLLSLALGLVLALGGDDGDADAATVTIDRIDSVANPIETEMIGSVRAVTDPDAYRWVTPSNAVAPGDAVARTDGSGTITFRWGPTSAVDEPREWASTLTMTETLPANTNLVSERFDCTLRRGDEPDTLVVLTVVVETPADPEQPSIATYDFQNFEFLTADIMTCGVPNAQPGATTTSTITTPTTAPPTTVPVTTAPATTVPPTTAPAPAPTTAPPTTTPETSAPPTTAPATSIMGVIESRSDLSTLVGLIDVAGLRDDLSKPGTITLFAPDDPAFDALPGGPDAPDVGDPDTVEGLLLAHTNLAEVLPAADVLALLEVEVANGGPQPVDAGAGTIGGAPIADTDLVADNGVVHVLGAVMPVQPAG